MRRLKAVKKFKENRTIPGWPQIRKAILDRDDYTCRICGNDNNLHVHHIDSNRKNNATVNLVTLCSTCHKAVHEENYKPWEHEDHPIPWGIVE